MCLVDGCMNGGKMTRGWCKTHYARWRKYGDPRGRGEKTWYATPAEAFAARTQPEGECVVWTGSGKNGYGQIWDGKRLVMAHRWAWEQAYGPIPDGMFVDHRCWNRACVSVSHLRLATRAQNQWNRSGAASRKWDLPRGVSPNKDGYKATVKHHGERHYLGTFPTVAEADAAAVKKRAELFGEFAGRP